MGLKLLLDNKLFSLLWYEPGIKWNCFNYNGKMAWKTKDINEIWFGYQYTTQNSQLSLAQGQKYGAPCEVRTHKH